MQFNNAQFERGIAQSQKSLAAFDNKLNTSFKDSRRSMDDLKALSKGLSFDTITDGVNKIAHSFTLMGRIGLQVMDDIAAKAIRTGKQLVSALTIDPVKSGFREYETQIGAIQTILSNTRSKGTTIDDVNQALDELNKYADMTIYNFTEMTRNIGTFTAAGVDLETSVSAIKGISNLAAISGSTSTQAATAMYQLSQALASGTIRLMDWNSVVNAGMGGEVFQDALKETARVHGIAIDEMIEKEGSFRETLQNGWLSSEIMLETLQKFTGDLSKEQILAKGYTEEQAEAIMQLGEDANDAATKVKTFSQLIDTLKEALGSGWTNTWEYIIGDFEEARELWTGVSDVLSGIINNSAEARNELLKQWKDLGGRDDLIRGLKDAFEALWGIVLAVGDAMDAIFPDVTVDTLLKLSEAVRTFGQNLKSTLAYWKVFKGEYETVETTVTVSEPEVLEGNLRRGLSNDNVKKLQERLAELGYDLGEMGADGIFGPKTEAALKAFQEDYDLLVDGIYGKDTHAKLTEVLGIGSGEETIITRTAQYVTQFGEALQLVQRIAKGAFAALHIGFQGLQFGWEVFKRLLGVLSPVAGALLHVGAAIGDCFVNLDKWLQESGIFSDWLSDVEEFLKPAAEWFSELGASILGFFGLGPKAGEMNGQISTFAQLWERISSSVRDLDIWGKLSDAFQRLKEAFSGIAPELKAFWESVKNAFGEKARELFESFVNFIPKAANAIGEFFLGILEFLDPVIQKIPAALEAIGGFFSGIWSSVKQFVANVPGYLSSVGEFFTGLIDRFVGIENLKNFFENVKEWFSSIFESIRSLFSGTGESETVVSNVKDSVTSVLDFLKSVFTRLSGFMSGISVPGMLAILGAIFAVSKIFGAIKSALQAGKALLNAGGLISTLNDFFGNFWKNLGGLNKQPKSRSLLMTAAAIGAIVGLIYLVAEMPMETLKKGGAIVGGIGVFLLALSILNKKFGTTSASASFQAKGFGGIAAAILTLVAAIAILGNMKIGTLIQGGFALTAIMTMLVGFLVVLNKLGGGTSFKMQGLLSLATSIGILIAAIAILGHMEWGTLLKGGVVLAGVLTILSAFMVALNKLGGGATFKMQGFIGLATAIGIFIAAIAILGHMEWGTLLKGGVALVGILTALAVFMIALNKLGGGTTFQMGGLIALAGAVAILGATVIAIGNISWENLAKGLLGVVALMGSLALVTKFAGGMSIKSGIASILSCVGLVLAIAAFGAVIYLLQDVDPGVMVAFGASFSAAILAFTAAINISSKVGIVGMLKGAVGLGLAIGTVVTIVIGIIAALGTALGAINKLTGGGFVSILEEGAKVFRSIGNIIGSFVGGIKEGILGDSDMGGYAEDVASFGEALSTFSESTDGITPDSISGAIAASKLIAQFVESLPKMGGVVGFFEGDQDFGGFAEDLLLFSSGISAFGEAVEELADNENLVSDTDSALDVMKSVQEFLDGLGSGNLFEFVKHNNISRMLGLIENFAGSVTVLSGALGGLSETTISADVESAIDAATEVAEALESMNQLDINTGGFRIFGLTVIESRTEEILRYIEEFGDAISSITNAFRGLDGDFDIVSAAASAVEAAKKITGFLGGSGEGSIPSLTLPSTTSPIASWFTGGNQVESALRYIKDFGAGMVQVTDAIKNVFADGEGNPIELDLVGATSSLVQIANDILAFLGGTGENAIPQLTIPERNTGVRSWIYGEGKVSDALAYIQQFGSGMSQVANAIATALKDEEGNLIDIDIVGVTGDLVESATAITDFLSGAGLNSVPMLTIPDAGSGFMSWIMNGANSTVETLITDIEGFGTSMTQVVGALTAVEGVDDVPTATESLISAAQAVLDFLDEFDDSKYDGIETKTGPFVAFFEGLNKQESFITYLKDFGTNMSEVANAAALIPDPEAFKSQVAAMVDGFNQIVDTFLLFGGKLEGDDRWGYASTNIISMLQYIQTLGATLQTLANPVDFTTGTPVDYSNLDTLFQPIEDFIGKLVALSDSAGSVGIESIKTLLDNIKTLFVSDTGTEYDTSSWLEGLDAESLATSITDFGNTVTGALMVVRDNLTTYSTDFSNAGKSLIAALNTGMTGSSSLAVSGIQTVLNAAHSAADSYRSKFVLVGWDICYGVRDGIRNGTSVVTSMAKSMARQAYNAAKAELDSNSPSKKFMELGEFSSEGFAIGIGNLSRVVEKSASGIGSSALDATKRSIASFASVLNDDMEADPVVRPVVDLSDVTKGAKRIGTMLSGSRSISVSASADRASRLAGEMTKSKNERQNGNEEGFMNPVSATYGGVNITGNDFYFRNEQDVRALASEIAVLTNSQRRGFGG